jgi:hypothetical protein
MAEAVAEVLIDVHDSQIIHRLSSAIGLYCRFRRKNIHFFTIFLA